MQHSRFMNFYKRLFLFACPLLLLTACPAPKTTDGLKKLKQDHYDFKDLKKLFHKGLTLRVPDFMFRYYNSSFMHKQDGVAYHNPEASLFISIERFTADEAEDITFAYETGKSELESVCRYYGDLRCNAVERPKLSILQKFENKHKLEGLYQFVEGKNYSYDYHSMMYMIAAIKKVEKADTNFFIVQMAVDSELAPYLQDDFQNMIYTAK